MLNAQSDLVHASILMPLTECSPSISALHPGPAAISSFAVICLGSMEANVKCETEFVLLASSQPISHNVPFIVCCKKKRYMINHAKLRMRKQSRIKLNISMCATPLLYSNPHLIPFCRVAHELYFEVQNAL